ncbi:MAG: hypothetical protein DRP66_00670 [Planctomycetota bacterium]|nr:MAG: hypothetical protein DRP66_00670 [Planctomycetota bacterium]
MIEKINNNQVPDILKESSSRQPERTREPADNQVDASLQVTYDALIEKAKEMPRQDADAVEGARRLLLSGRLESPENIRAAAENIAKFGI